MTISLHKNSFFIYCIALFLILISACKKETVQQTPVPPVIPKPQPSPATITPRPKSISAHNNGYYEYLPEGYLTDAPAAQYPLIIFFHGGSETGEDSAALSKLLRNGPLKLIKDGTFPVSFNSNGKTFKFIIIAPQYTSSGTTYPNEIDALIEYTKVNYRVDASRIYLTGLSFGGGLAWTYVGENISYANKIAAMVPIAAYIPSDRDEFKISIERAQRIASSNLPIWSTHNSGDRTCPLVWVTDAYKLLTNSSPAPNPLPRLTVFNSNSHGGWTQTYIPTFKENNLNIYEWMLQYQR